MAKKNFKANPATAFISKAEKIEKNNFEDLKPSEQEKIIKEHLEKMETKSARMNLLIQPTVLKLLKKSAKVEGVSANELVNTLIKDYLAKEGLY